MLYGIGGCTETDLKWKDESTTITTSTYKSTINTTKLTTGDSKVSQGR